MQDKLCPMFSNSDEIHPLNPNVCVMSGDCKYCGFYTKNECEGCSVNMKGCSKPALQHKIKH